MNDTQLLEDIEFVRHMIENNRRSLVDNGITYIATGIYVVVGVASSTLMGAMGKEHWIPWLWLVLMALLVGFNILAQKKTERGTVRRTFATQIFGAVWLACGIPVVIVSLLFFIGGVVPLSVLLACVSACLGIGYFLTGVINDLRFMKYLAGAWWAGVAVALSWRSFGEEYQLGLFFSLLILLLEVVPGVIIYKKWKHADDE